jgi:hypothetical protein
MAIRLRRPDVPEAGEGRGGPERAWLGWLQQTASLMYVIGGGVLLFQYRHRLRRQVVLVTGILFVLYGACRFFWVRRASRR